MPRPHRPCRFESLEPRLLLVYDLALTVDAPESGGEFGRAVAIDGDRLAVGAWQANEAYVYDISGATPVLTHRLPNPTPNSNDVYGISVAISGDTVVVGDIGDSPGAPAAGSAYVFDISTSTPMLVESLHNPDPHNGDWFGTEVAVSGDTVVIGAYRDNTQAQNAGAAYIYDLAAATPTIPIESLYDPTPASTELYGVSVDIHEHTIVVGASWESSAATAAGAAYVYELANDVATLTHTISNPDPAEFDQFGTHVAIAGNRVVVSAITDDAAGEDAGAAYVFNVAGALPVLQHTLLNPAPANFEGFGDAVDIAGQTVIVGARLDDSAAEDAGIAYTYDLSAALPETPISVLGNPTPDSGENFGISVALGDGSLAIGAYGHGADNRGAAYVYRDNGFTSVDFDQDAAIGCRDIDALSASIANGDDPPDFDLNGDMLVDLRDQDVWLQRAGQRNIGAAYLLGDADLNGAVGGEDFIIWNLNKFTSNSHWCDGNFNGDTAVDGFDFIFWNDNKFTSSDTLVIDSLPSATSRHASNVVHAPLPTASVQRQAVVPVLATPYQQEKNHRATALRSGQTIARPENSEWIDESWDRLD